jgi:hypothetical protein
MKLSEIVDALDATLLTGEDKLDKILLTGLTTVQVIRTAMVAGVGAVVFVRKKKPPQEVIDMAQAQGIPLISSPYSMFVSCGRLHACNLTGLDGKR